MTGTSCTYLMHTGRFLTKNILFTNFKSYRAFDSNYLTNYTKISPILNILFRDKIAQLVMCRIGKLRVADSIPGRLGHFGLFLSNIVYPILPQTTQLYNGYLA